MDYEAAVGRPVQCLRAVSWSEFGVVEGLEHPSLPVVYVQYHLERMTGAHRRQDTVDGGAELQIRSATQSVFAKQRKTSNLPAFLSLKNAPGLWKERK